MNVEIITQNENKLLDRKEVLAKISFDGVTPKKSELKQAVSGKIAANPDTMVIRRVKGHFGIKSVEVLAHIYSNKDSMMRVEPHHIKVREGLAQKKEKKKKAVAPAKKK